ncbi:MAG: c-type cytochrome [Methyloceanibacter sp.]|jgi:thiosulfate dehydrogenase|nr:c-type cytochrome [Methyloceanibacter sp.]
MDKQGSGRSVRTLAIFVGAAISGLVAGYLLWGRAVDWYAVPDVVKLKESPENDLIRYGHALIVDTAGQIGKNAKDADKRYAGNDLSCVNCHLNAGLQPFAAPFVSTFATFPMTVDDQVITLTERINGCMRRSMNGKNLPVSGREMEAIIAYIKYLGHNTPQGVRVRGMGLLTLQDAPAAPDATRGETVYAKLCASCHKPDGQGERKASPAAGYSIPPLWGDDSFNAGAGMAKLAYAAAYIRANMPFTINYEDPVLNLQQAWDVAAFMVSKKRPPAPTETATEAKLPE